MEDKRASSKQWTRHDELCFFGSAVVNADAALLVEFQFSFAFCFFVVFLFFPWLHIPGVARSGSHCPWSRTHS